MQVSSIVKYILVLVSYSCIFSWVSAQHEHYHKCGQPEAELLLQSNNPNPRTRQDFSKWMGGMVRKGVPVQREVLTLPVVVHVVHDDEAVGIGDNITASQINSQIDVLNEDFRRRLNTNGYNNDPNGADIEIEFCLAQVDPDGNAMPEPGIDRVNRLLEGFSAPPYGINYHQNTIQQATFWDPDKYLNIWVSDLANDFLGFTILPGDTTSPRYKDGVTITPTSFGRKGSVTPPYNLGRTLTHEIGHWLGLLHIWGDGGCSVDDDCADTPESDQPNYGCPTVSPVRCNTDDMFQNYMDYTDDACMNIFTQCQKTKMRAVMANFSRRSVLLTSNVCQGTGAPLAAFDASKIFACEGSQIQFSNQSVNTTNSWRWSFPGGVPDTSNLENPVVTYPNPGQYTVSLTVGNSIGNSTLSRTQFINITPDREALLYEETFENGLNDWTVNNDDSQITWELEAVSGSRNGQYAASIRMYLYPIVNEIDELISPVLDLSNYFELEMKFDHAYRAFSSGSSEDSLIIMASTDGGNTYPHVLYRNAEDGNYNFATNSPLSNDFVPQSDQDWCYQGSPGAGCNTLNLRQFNGEKNFRIKFVTKNGFGNNLYIDNIRLFGSCSPSVISSVAPTKEGIKIYPNPVNEKLWVELPSAEAIVVELWSTLGQRVKNWTVPQNQAQSRIALSLNDVAQGTYVLKIKGKNWSKIQKLVHFSQ